MKRKNIFSLGVSFLYILGAASVAIAGTLSPESYETTININNSSSVEKTVTVNPEDISNIINESTETIVNKYDILFLADNTGSMGNAIANVQDNALSLLQTLSTEYDDIQFGVARYYGDPEEASFTHNGKKFVQVKRKGTSSDTITKKWKYKRKLKWRGRNYYQYKITTSGAGLNKTQYSWYSRKLGSGFSYYYQENGPSKAYQLQEAVSGGSIDDSIAAINNWEAFGGGDLPEANMFALHQAATSGASTNSGLASLANTNWRPDAKRIIVWFGDAASHELSVDQAETIKALKDNDITVIAINASNSTTSLTTGINSNSQASSIADATDGEYAAVYSSNLADTMLDLIGDAITNITTKTEIPGTVDLVFESTGDTSGLSVSYTCIDPLGCDDVKGGESRKFKMDVTGNYIGEYEFKTVVKDADGEMIAEGSNDIEVIGHAD
ncbi:MAG: VWA domain-containing protein [Pleurocapsa sp. MO_226.B13]|nr:VWA domain-containing protein [Pleurocapsa sp. MO_226.B13]